jgi:predicted RNA-binding Zn ribbon-like protein
VRGSVRPLAELRLLGGALPLDFVNSVDWRLTDEPVEYLGDYHAALAWSLRLGTVSQDEAAALRALAANDPVAATAAATRLRHRREQLYEALSAIANAQPPDPGRLDAVRRWYGAAIAAGRLHEVDGAIKLRWPDDQLDRPAWPLAHAAWNLLCAPVLDWLKMCPADGCGWLFLDRSKNHTRRWCSMDGCGARMKMRRAYARSRRAAAEL